MCACSLWGYMQLKQTGSGRLPDGLTAAAPSRWLSNTHSPGRTHINTHKHTHTQSLTSYCMLMILALGTFVSGLTSHTHFHSSIHVTVPPAPCESPPPSALCSPACQSNSPGETATWDRSTPTKETLIDRCRQRSAGTVTEGWAGRR